MQYVQPLSFEARAKKPAALRDRIFQRFAIDDAEPLQCERDCAVTTLNLQREDQFAGA